MWGFVMTAFVATLNFTNYKAIDTFQKHFLPCCLKSHTFLLEWKPCNEHVHQKFWGVNKTNKKYGSQETWWIKQAGFSSLVATTTAIESVTRTVFPGGCEVMDPAISVNALQCDHIIAKLLYFPHCSAKQLKLDPLKGWKESVSS